MVSRYVPDRGHIIWIDLDPSIGHEQGGRRPALVLSLAALNVKTGMALICPITSKRKGYSFEVSLNNTDIEGVVLTDQIRSIDWEFRKVSFVGEISAEGLSLVQGYVVAIVTG